MRQWNTWARGLVATACVAALSASAWAQDPAAPAAPDASISLGKWLEYGGWVGWVIIVCSVAMVALIIERHGQYVKDGKSLDPDAVRQILLSTATDHACPAGGVENYEDEGRPAEFNAVCDGTTAANGLYGEGIIDALAAVQ